MATTTPLPGRIRILVVDDDPSIVALLTEALGDAGYEVVAAMGGAALALARAVRPAVILLDLMMPAMDGAEVSRLLRADAATARIPIIAMTATPSLRTPGGPMVADDRLTKPFDLDRLYTLVARWATPP